MVGLTVVLDLTVVGFTVVGLTVVVGFRVVIVGLGVVGFGVVGFRMVVVVPDVKLKKKKMGTLKFEGSLKFGK